MNPVFWVIVILLLVGLWFLLTPLFRALGNWFTNLTDNANKTMFDEEEGGNK